MGNWGQGVIGELSSTGSRVFPGSSSDICRREGRGMLIDPEIFSLTLPTALLGEAIWRARAGGVSLQQFISQAIEEKLMLSGVLTQSSGVPPTSRPLN
jgi:hypothetical protein